MRDLDLCSLAVWPFLSLTLLGEDILNCKMTVTKQRLIFEFVSRILTLYFLDTHFLVPLFVVENES